MVTTVGARLPGEDTLIGSWAALMPGSPGSREVRTGTSVGVASWALWVPSPTSSHPGVPRTTAEAANLADAYRRGARTASLQATRMGHPLYDRLGFRPVGRYEEWVPAAVRAADVAEDHHADAQ